VRGWWGSRTHGAGGRYRRLLASLEPAIEAALLNLPATAEAYSRAATVLDGAFQGSGINA